MLGAAAVCAGLAVSAVNSYTNEVQAQVGPLVPVVVARTEIAKGKRLTPANARLYIAERHVPKRFVPPSALQLTSAALGYRALTTIRAGDYVSEASLGETGEARPAGLGRPLDGRLVEVPVAGAGTVAPALRPGARVDVLITTDRGAATPRTYLALQRIELVDFAGAADPAAATDGERNALATLRVTLSQAVLLTAARNFARELRLVPRAEGDDRRVRPTTVAAGDLAR
jgi:pilus assembly protein CpaB